MIMDTISKTIIALEKIIILAFISGIISINGYAQENTGQIFFKRNLNHRIYLGLYKDYCFSICLVYCLPVRRSNKPFRLFSAGFGLKNNIRVSF
jgi:hypothetical protein